MSNHPTRSSALFFSQPSPSPSRSPSLSPTIRAPPTPPPLPRPTPVPSKSNKHKQQKFDNIKFNSLDTIIKKHDDNNEKISDLPEIYVSHIVVPDTNPLFETFHKTDRLLELTNFTPNELLDLNIKIQTNALKYKGRGPPPSITLLDSLVIILMMFKVFKHYINTLLN